MTESYMNRCLFSSYLEARELVIFTSAIY